MNVRPAPRSVAAGPLLLDLLGPVRLTGPNGKDYTPRSPLRRAILSVVALSGDVGVSRARLQDLFWSQKDAHLAAQSLRTALHGLRRDLQHCVEPLLEIDATQVRLVPGAVRTDVLAFLEDGTSALPLSVLTDPPDLMEGVDICAEEFEEWLRDQRQHWHDRISDAAVSDTVTAVPVVPKPDPARDHRPTVGLLRPVAHVRATSSLYLGEALVDQIAAGLRDYVGARVFDYRDPDGPSGGARLAENPDLYLRLHLYEIAGEVSLRVLVLNRSTEELLWTVQRGPITLDRARIEHAEILGLLGEVIERLAGTLALRKPEERSAPVTPCHALTEMFQLDHTALDDLRRELERAWDMTDGPIYPALLAYLNTFRVGEHWSTTGVAVEDETRRYVRQVRACPNSGGLAYGLAGHALGYVLHDHEGAGDMLDHSLRLSPQSAFCWDHLALHFTYGGRYDDARIASRNALRIGAFSPIEFTMQTTRSMIATLQGDFGTATDLGARVLSCRPNFGAALRYMSISLAHRGDIDRAKGCVRRIRDMDPSFSVDWVRQDRMAVRDETAKAILIDGLTHAGAT